MRSCTKNEVICSSNLYIHLVRPNIALFFPFLPTSSISSSISELSRCCDPSCFCFFRFLLLSPQSCWQLIKVAWGTRRLLSQCPPPGSNIYPLQLQRATLKKTSPKCKSRPHSCSGGACAYDEVMAWLLTSEVTEEWSEALRRHDSPAVWKLSGFIPQMENTKYQRCHLILGANMWRVLLNLITETADTHVVKLSQVVWTPSSKHIEVCLHILRTTQPVKTAGQCNPDDVSGVILARAWTPLTVRLCYKAGVYG